MNIILPILFILFFTWGVYKWNFFNLQGISRKFLVTAFILKIIAGVTLTMIYTHYYPVKAEADTFRYFEDSYHLHRALFENPKAYLRMMLGVDDGKDLMPYLDSMNNWFPAERTTFYNDNRTVIRINALIRWISFGSYYVHLLIFSFLSQVTICKSINTVTKKHVLFHVRLSIYFKFFFKVGTKIAKKS